MLQLLILIDACAAHFQNLVTSVTVTLANLISVQSSTARSGQSPNRRAFLASGNCADRRARRSGAGHCQLIAMFLPERPAMTMPAVSDRLGRRYWARGEHQNQGN
jgi:hypothetical protein